MNENYKEVFSRMRQNKDVAMRAVHAWLDERKQIDGADWRTHLMHRRDALDFEEIILERDDRDAERVFWGINQAARNWFCAIANSLNADGCEIIYTGGGIYCGLIRVEDGWFYGELNGWGCIWKTREQAMESIPDEEEGLVRYIENLDEQIGIMTRIYSAALISGNPDVRCDLTDDRIKDLMRDIVRDLKSWMSDDGE